ncbi:MAG: flagellin [Nitrospirota bacterium]|nr:flagellin [Nitrospirota bacterium]MDP2383762.1 flagellin [Nitrospirota bacterium]
MRVTEQQAYGVLVSNIQRARAKALATQEQISTGKKVVKPSDNANAFDRIVSTKFSMAKADQRIRNLGVATTRLDLTDSALRGVTNALARVKELAVQFANGTNGAAERAIGAREVKQLFLQLQELGNAEHAGGQSIFGGTGRHGRATGVAITAPIALTGGTNDSLVVTVDGTTSGTITLGTASLTGSGLAALVQRRINTDSTLLAAGRSVTVTFDTDHLVITSNDNGLPSSVEVTGGSSLSALGFNGGSTTTGASAFAIRAATGVSARNSGSAVISQGTVSDPSAVTLNDYLVKFSAATTFDLFNVTTVVGVQANSTNTGGAVKSDSGVVNPSLVTMDNYEVRVKNIYTVTAGSNDGIRFDPGTGAVTATLAAGSYTGAQLAAQTKTALEAVSGGTTYTVSFDESTGRFGLTNDGTNATGLSLLYSDTASTGRSLLGSSGRDHGPIAVGGTVVSDVDTTGLAGVSTQQNVYNTTLATNIFNITSANNTLIVNDDGGTTDRTITLSTGSYTGAQLATEVAAQLNANRHAANTTAYTVDYGSVTAGRITINNPAGNANSLIMRFGNAGSTVGQIMGSGGGTVTETAGASASTLNNDAGYVAYLSGANIDFDGLRVVLQDGTRGPRNGDVFAVAQARSVVLTNQSYVSGGTIVAEGLRFSLRDGAAAPASGDLFTIQTGVQYQGDDGLQTIEVGDGQTVKTNQPGNLTFTGPAIDLFASVKNLTASLNGNYVGGIQRGLAAVDVAVDQVSSVQGELGALVNRLVSNKGSLDETKVFLSNILSTHEDVDLVEAISQLTLQQQAIEAAGATLNRIFESSLLKYLK